MEIGESMLPTESFKCLSRFLPSESLISPGQTNSPMCGILTHLSESVLVNPVDLPKVGPGDSQCCVQKCVNLTIKGGYFSGQLRARLSK